MKEKVETFFLSLASLFRSRFERTESREKKFCFSFWLSDPDSLSPSISLCESQRGGFLQCILTFPILPTLLHVKNVWMCGGGQAPSKDDVLGCIGLGVGVGADVRV